MDTTARFLPRSILNTTGDLVWYIWDRVTGRTVEMAHGLADATDRAGELNRQ